MIWGSIIIMTIIDLCIIGMSTFALWAFINNRKTLSNLNLIHGFFITLCGLILISAFYLVDLATMFLLPTFMPMNEAMAIMKDLHLNYQWVVTLVGVGLIVAGITYMIRRLFPEIEMLLTNVQESQKSLEKEVIEHKQSEVELKEAKIIADKANEAKSEFLANMSHEIRTPMQAIIGTADVLHDTELTAEQLESVKLMQKASNNLLEIINNILDISRIEAGHVEVENTDFDLSIILEITTKICSYQAGEKGIDLTYNIEKGTPEYLIGDKVYLQQILINIVGNAIKFTEEGAVKIAVKGDPGSDTDNKESCTLIFSVNDTGIGIPPDKLETIFERFSQADTSSTRIYGGTGLGVTISRGLVEKMGGRIWAESEVGKGSTFYFTVSLGFQKTKKASIPDAIQATEMPVDARSLSILLVDDSEDNCMLIQTLLKKTAYEIDIAENGKVALEKFTAGDYHLVLMDMEMPVMDGYTATKEIRKWEKEEKKEATPILALTAHAFEEHHQKSIDAGCTDHISKPIKKKKLLEIICEYSKDSTEIK